VIAKKVAEAIKCQQECIKYISSVTQSVDRSKQFIRALFVFTHTNARPIPARARQWAKVVLILSAFQGDGTDPRSWNIPLSFVPAPYVIFVLTVRIFRKNQTCVSHVSKKRFPM
jgi:hypothetical protein